MSNSKFVTALCVCYQEKQYFLRQAIESIWNFADKIIIVDGSPFGPSTDGTKEWALSLDKNKVIFEEGTYTTLWAQKNVAMKLAPTETQYFFTVDADEVYKEEDLYGLRMMIDTNDPPPVIMFKMYHTWKDLKHYQIGGPYSNPFIRLFKNVSGIHYDPPPAGDEPQDDQGRYLKIHKDYVEKTIYLGKALTFHTGHSKPIKSEVLKILRYAKWESASISEVMRRLSLNGWLNKENTEGILEVEFPKTLKEYKDPCEGCPKDRGLIDFCWNHCEISKKIEYELPSYNFKDLKDTLEKHGIEQRYEF